MAVSDLDSLCGLPVSGLYVLDASSLEEPVGFVRCSELGSACQDRICDCRNSISVSIDSSTVLIPVCVGSCTDSQTTNCSGNGSAAINASERGLASTNNVVVTELATVTAADASNSASGSINFDNATASSSSSMSTTVMVVIIVVCVAFVAVVSWFVRGYCIRKHEEKHKHSSQNPASSVPSPTTSTTPSFPAFDRRTRSLSSGSRERYSANTGNAARGYVMADTPYRENEARGFDRAGVHREGMKTHGEEPREIQYGNHVAPVHRVPQQPSVSSSSQTKWPAASTQGMKMQYSDWVASGQPIRQVFSDPESSEEEDVMSDFDDDPMPLLDNPSTARNGDSSIASFATTVEVPGRRRPTALKKRPSPQERVQPATRQSEASSIGVELVDSFASDASLMSSGFTDSSYYRSTGATSSSSMYRSTGSSSSSFVSPSSTGSSVYRNNHEFEI